MIKEAVNGLQIFCKLFAFSFSILVAGCQQKDSASKDISVIWEDDRATGVSFSKSFLENFPEDSIQKLVQVRLSKHGDQPVIPGEYIINKDEVIFEPIIPFTRGLSYQILIKQQLLGIIAIPKSTVVPQLLAIYPTIDTVPENLLKMYFVFSHPMLEGHSSEYIKLTDQHGDTLPNVFLNLQQELWNDEGTVLTLWLDPGRIKRDLQPNKMLGPPIKKGNEYKLKVSAEWPGSQGTSLKEMYTKNFVAGVRDTISPSPDDWLINTPRYGTIQPLGINLGEPLDYILLQNTITLADPGGHIVNGTWQIDNDEMKLNFIPVSAWIRGSYRLQIEARLEDLAGNNLNRLFDRDLKRPGILNLSKNLFEKEFQIN